MITREAETSSKAAAMFKAFGIACLVIALLGYVVHQLISKPAASAANLAYFTTDDGATLFTDSADKLAPFDHDGKPASHAIACSSDDGKTRKVAYLERFTADGKVRYQQRVKDFKAGKSTIPPVPLPGDTEVKLPGSASPWISTADISQATHVKSLTLSSDPNATLVVP